MYFTRFSFYKFVTTNKRSIRKLISKAKKVDAYYYVQNLDHIFRSFASLSSYLWLLDQYNGNVSVTIEHDSQGSTILRMIFNTIERIVFSMNNLFVISHSLITRGERKLVFVWRIIHISQCLPCYFWLLMETSWISMIKDWSNRWAILRCCA